MDRYYYETEHGHYRLRDRQNGQQTVALIFHVREADIITKAMNDADRDDADRKTAQKMADEMMRGVKVMR